MIQIESGVLNTRSNYRREKTCLSGVNYSFDSELESIDGDFPMKDI